GVDYLTRYKLQRYPMGDGKFERQINWLGKRNDLGQIYLTRNVGFEPSEFESSECVQNCLNDIEIAFKFRKPAIISSHRVNYLGYLCKDNREKGLNLLDELLFKINNKWPDVEFFTSEELGNLIAKDKISTK
ncbi:MAG: hypothetical protein MH472_14275, partial [Bacteroidia bacterium]|nr:hypothetical protein [Bacteroidia bacterium]